MQNKPIYPRYRRIANGLNTILLKALSGFSMGVSYAILFAAFIPANNLIAIMLILGVFFGLSRGIKSIFNVYERNQHEKHLIKLIGKEDGEVFKPKKATLSDFQRYTKQFNQTNKRFNSFFYYVANGMGLAGLFFFFAPASITPVLNPLTKILISVLVGIANATIALYLKYNLIYQAKEKVKYIENYSMPHQPPSHLFKYKHALKPEQIFQPTSRLEELKFLTLTPLLEFLITLITGTTSIFSILVLFCIGFSLSLPWIPPVTAVIISGILGFALAIKSAVERYSIQAKRVRYIRRAVRCKSNNESFPTFYSYANQKSTSLISNKTTFVYKQHATFKYLWSFINGASSGIGFATSIISIYLFAYTAPAGPIFLGLIFLSGFTFGCMNVYREFFSKDLQNNKINFYRHQLNERYLEYKKKIKEVRVIQKKDVSAQTEVAPKTSKKPLKNAFFTKNKSAIEPKSDVDDQQLLDSDDNPAFVFQG